jgi:TruD family tRNA pseudouridine synthase
VGDAASKPSPSATTDLPIRSKLAHLLALIDAMPANAEAEVGIFDYASPEVPGIGGILKMQPADFIVSELRAGGEEVTLDSGPAPEDDGVQPPPGWAAAEEDETAADEWWVEGESDEEDEAEWAGAGQILTRFVLEKQRMDTLGALGELASLLGVPARNFSVAGLKDHRAVTCQEVVVRGVPPSAVNALVPPPGIRLGRAWPAAAPMHLGGCGGNRFFIVLRGVAAGGHLATKRVRRAMRALRRRGFVNYFGTQRFGASGSANHEIGLRALLWRYEEGVRLVMTPPPGAKLSGAEAEAYDAWAVGRDVRSAYRLMPRKAFLQKALLARLCGEDQGRGRGRPANAQRGGGGEGGGAWGGGDGYVVHASEGGEEREGHEAGSGDGEGDGREHGWTDRATGQGGWRGGGGRRGCARRYGWAAPDEWSCRDAFLSLPLAQRRLFAHAYFSRLWNVAVSERLRR